MGKPTPMTKHHEWTESQPMSPFKTETTRKTTMMTMLDVDDDVDDDDDDDDDDDNDDDDEMCNESMTRQV